MYYIAKSDPSTRDGRAAGSRSEERVHGKPNPNQEGIMRRRREVEGGTDGMEVETKIDCPEGDA